MTFEGSENSERGSENSENSENSESPSRNDHLFGDFCLLRFKSVRYNNSEHNSENSGGILGEFWGNSEEF